MLGKPGIALASKGFTLSYPLAESLRGSKSLAASPESKRIYQKAGAFYEAGDTFLQPELARTLSRIAQGGAKEFYEGETATLLAKDQKEHGGLITLEKVRVILYRPAKK